MKRFFQKMIDRLLNREQSADRLARSVSIGLFAAFSPYLGLQTWIIFPIAWALSSNIPVAMIVLYTVNNPWTIIPIFVFDYAVGYWLTETLLGLNLGAYNPGWMEWVNTKLGNLLSGYVDVGDICLWCLVIGGTLVASAISLAAYPFVYRFFDRIIQKRKEAAANE
jgi:uncharacterized protein (DUF2062 family)